MYPQSHTNTRSLLLSYRNFLVLPIVYPVLTITSGIGLVMQNNVITNPFEICIHPCIKFVSVLPGKIAFLERLRKLFNCRINKLQGRRFEGSINPWDRPTATQFFAQVSCTLPTFIFKCLLRRHSLKYSSGISARFLPRLESNI